MSQVKIFHVPDRYVVPAMMTPLGFIACWRISYILYHPQERFFISNLITCLLVALVSFGISFRWWTACITLTNSDIVVRKLFQSIAISLSDVEKFEYVVGQFFSYTYVGLLNGSNILARTSYGPTWTFRLIPRSRRLLRWLDELNCALGEAQATGTPVG